MTRFAHFAARLARSVYGSMAVETAIVAPVLAMMAIGGFEASSIVARDSELQSAAAESASIVRASPPADQAARDAIRNIALASIDPKNSNPNDTVAVVEIYRCGTGAYVTVKPTCATNEALSTYIRVTLTDKYVPSWTKFGIANTINYSVVRTVQVS